MSVMENQNPASTPEPVIPSLEAKSPPTKLILLGLLFVLALGAGALFFFSKQSPKPMKKAKEKQVANKQASPSATPLLKTMRPSITSLPTPEPTVDETAVLEGTMSQVLSAKFGEPESTYIVSVSEIDGNSGKGMITTKGEDTGGGMWLSYKEDGVWKLVWDGNGIIECSVFSLYPDFSTKLMPECYDTATESNVTR